MLTFVCLFVLFFSFFFFLFFEKNFNIWLKEFCTLHWLVTSFSNYRENKSLNHSRPLFSWILIVHLVLCLGAHIAQIVRTCGKTWEFSLFYFMWPTNECLPSVIPLHHMWDPPTNAYHLWYHLIRRWYFRKTQV